jgi:hypothetical protein
MSTVRLLPELLALPEASPSMTAAERLGMILALKLPGTPPLLH